MAEDDRRKPTYHSRKEPPTALFDAAGTVSAAIFGARRLPELWQLWAKSMLLPSASGNNNKKKQSAIDAIPFDTKHLQSTGCKTSSRHLRRRVRSHQGRHRHRFPTANSKKKKDSSTPTNNTADPPYCRHKRRRNSQLLHAEHHRWRTATTRDEEEALPAISDGTTATTLHWIMTHIWHAKRFHMMSLLTTRQQPTTKHSNAVAWKIPVLHTNRGAQAALRLVREGRTVVQDATWSRQPITLQLQYNNDASMTAAALQSIIPDFPTLQGGNRNHSSFPQSGSGLLYARGQFPFGCQGPVSWILLANRPLFEKNEKASPDASSELFVFVYLFVHPVLQEYLLEELKALQDDSWPVDPCLGIQGGLGCLLLRGRNVLQSLQSALEKMPSLSESVSSPSSSWGDLLLPLKEDGLIENGRVVLVGGRDELLLVGHAPPDAALPCNAAACGVDIYCRSGDTQELFGALILSGKTCPVGVAEMAHLALEQSPPQPVFPRDYPDTPSGREYWNSVSNSGDDGENRWTSLRKYLEGGLGRIRKKRAADMKTLSWNNVVSTGAACQGSDDDDDGGNANIVMIRGVYGEPIAAALSQTWLVVDEQQEGDATVGVVSAPLRRKRRKVGDPMVPVPLPYCKPALVEQHQQACDNLLQALSLPACMMVSIVVHGAGTLDVGSPVRAFREGNDDEDSRLLGYVTTSAFSHTRGRAHGIAIVGTYPFLSELREAHTYKSIVLARPLSECKREVQLKVVAADSCVCTLSLSF